jgi:tRNA(Arg) A34 adenosine deaminase TadA
MTDEQIMRIAIEEARKGDHPFGAVIVNKEGEVLARAFNTIFRDCDPTAHGEIQAIRQLTAKRENGRLEEGLTLYTTCDPCSMCASAIAWSGIDEVVIGAEMEDIRGNWHTINVSCEKIFAAFSREIKVRRGVLREECRKLYESKS